MSLVREIRVRPKPVEAFAGIVGPDSVTRVRTLAQTLRRKLGQRVIWNVNSTAAGGGVAEMLHTLLPYVRGLGVDTRWLVIGGGPEFFKITKRLHNALHGERGDGSELGREAAGSYDRTIRANAEIVNEYVRPGDMVILHDPQTAGLVPHLAARQVGVVWRCHIGSDVRTQEADAAWAFLEPHLKPARTFIFSRFSYLPEFLYHGRCMVVPPSIDPFSPKNQDMDCETVRAILIHAGVVSGSADGAARSFLRPDGTLGRVERRAEILREGPPPALDVPLVVQVSRWDRLKDPVGVLRGFVRSMRGSGADHAGLVLAGPSVRAIEDDPEGAAVFDEVAAMWKDLPEAERRRVYLVNLPMDDLEENAAMVNAVQRHAAAVVQKSLREGFGLTVTEAMWKARPVIASAVGGIRDQIEHGVSGLLLRNPGDLDAFAGAVNQVLANRGLADRMGRNARRRVCQNYLGLGILAQYDDLVERLEHELPE